MKLIVFILAIILLTAAAEPKTDQGFDGIWREYGVQMESEGITKPMAKVAFRWTELQYYLGYCKNYLLDDDILFWRDWWKGTPLENSSYGRKILESGSSNFDEGERKRRKRPPSPGLCHNVLAGWSRNMIREMP